jgi:uncharacterized damage-inducible protein DinB
VLLSEQYRLVADSRRVLMDYCDSLPQVIYEQQAPDLPEGYSIRVLHGHIADCYLHWLGNFGLKQSIDLSGFETLGIEAIREKYDLVESVTKEFLARFESDPLEEITGARSKDHPTVTISAIKLFSHVITHEYHHKGQIVQLGRRFGFPASDTDLLRT